MRYTLIKKDREQLIVFVHPSSEEEGSLLDRVTDSEFKKGEDGMMENILDDIIARFAPGRTAGIFELEKAGKEFIIKISF